MKKSYIFIEGDSETFSVEEVKALKEIAREKIQFTKTFLCDKDGNRYPYRNRFETKEDAEYNLAKLGIKPDITDGGE